MQEITYVSQKNCSFYLDGQSNTHCFIRGTRYYFINYIRDNFPQFSRILWEPNEDGIMDFKPQYLMPDEYSAVATWNPSDESYKFDNSIGQLYAYNEIKEKVNWALRKRFLTFLDDLDKQRQQMIEGYAAYSNKLYDNTAYRVTKLYNYFNEEPPHETL